MPTAQKAKAIEQAKDWYQRSNGLVFTDYRGLKVKELQALRADLRAKGGEIHIVKNTLFRLAAGDDIQNIPYEMHNGPTAITFCFENETECAKALFDFAKTHKNLEVKGGYIGGKQMSAKDVEAFSKLPPRDVLLAQVIGAIAAPLSSLVGVIEALYADPIRTIGAVADKVAEGTPIPAAAPEAKAEPVAEAESAAGTSAGPVTEAPVEAVPEATPEAPVEEPAVSEAEAPAVEESPAAENE